MIREIIELGDPLLRAPAQAVEDVSAPELQELIRDLRDTMDAAQGIGIAAPQIGVSKRVFIVASKPNERYPNAPLMEPTAMINPELEWSSDEVELGWEGCLSIPGLRARVPRPVAIRARYLDSITLQAVRCELTGFYRARVVTRVRSSRWDRLSGSCHFEPGVCYREGVSPHRRRAIPVTMLGRIRFIAALTATEGMLTDDRTLGSE